MTQKTTVEQNASASVGVLAAYVKDIKPDVTGGGDFVSGAWRERDLNDLSGDTSFIAIDGISTFTLQTGLYAINASLMAYQVNSHQSKLRIDGGADVIIGGCGRAGQVDDTNSFTFVVGEITVLTPTTYTLEHRCQTTKNVNGFGINNSFAVGEVFAQIQILKLG